MPFKKTKHLVFSRYLSLLCLLLLLLVASVFVAVSLGAVTIDIGDTYGVIFSKLGLPIARQSIAKPLEADGIGSNLQNLDTKRIHKLKR